MNIADEAEALLSEINSKIKALPAYLHPYIEKNETWAVEHPFLNALVWFGLGAALVAIIWAS